MINVVGLVPAAGRAERLSGLPKYLLPLPEPETYLLDVLCRRMRYAADSLLIGASPSNRAILEHYAPDDAMVYTTNSETMSQTVLAARKWCGDSVVVFGMPDAYWDGEYIYERMVDAVREQHYPVVAALWRVQPGQERKLGMVSVDRKLKSNAEFEFLVSRVVDKPQQPVAFSQAWGALAWGPDFWQFINEDDPHVGYALTRALAHGVKIQAHSHNGAYWDCGTREDYFKCLQAAREVKV